MYLLLFLIIIIPVHQNYVGLDNDKAPFFLSIVLNDANNTCVPLYRAILFKKTVNILPDVSLVPHGIIRLDFMKCF